MFRKWNCWSQGYTKEAAIAKLKEAIDSIEEAQMINNAVYSASLLINELHEFLTIEGVETISEPLGMRALYA